MAQRDARLTSFDAPTPVTAPASAGVRALPEARTVSEIVQAVNAVLGEHDAFSRVWVRGEISNLTMHSSGHWYFSLKDESSTLAAAMFRGANARVRFRLEEGMEVLARGNVKVYGARSQLQIVVEELQPVGAGALQLAYEQLKTKLAAEGLFAPERKRTLPPHPRRIGVVTSLTGAAVRDIVRVASQRHAGVSILVCGARVQGEGAAQEIVSAIARLAATDCDVLIVGRGGGSIEDLWAFNEEAVVRAIAACAIPVVSAVGHETDFTLSDLVADLRAATPSQAAEIVVPDAEAIAAGLDDADARMAAALERIVPDLRQHVDDLLDRATASVRALASHDVELLAVNSARLDALSPLATLARGYAVARAADGRVLRSVGDAPPGSEVGIVLQDGALDATVQRARKKETPP